VANCVYSLKKVTKAVGPCNTQSLPNIFASECACEQTAENPGPACIELWLSAMNSPRAPTLNHEAALARS